MNPHQTRETDSWAEFLSDVQQHQIMVLKDDDLYRHIRFKAPGNFDQHFDLITWPGALCYTGDMGTFVFERSSDMFSFFRSKTEGEPPNFNLRINPSYWAEKLQATDRADGDKEWSPDLFKAIIKEHFETWAESAMETPEEKAQVWEEVESDFFGDIEDLSKPEAYSAAINFEYKGCRPFDSVGEHDTDTFTSRFLWCCHALVWGIRRYDEYVKVQSA